MAPHPVVTLYRGGAAVFRNVPAPIGDRLADWAFELACSLSAERRLLVERHLRRALGPDVPDADFEIAVAETFRSYGRYWAESFRLTRIGPDALDAAMGYEGFDHLARARAEGHGCICAVPHLGGWEWAANWLARVGNMPVTAVVEPVEPPELFEFFVAFREALGMHVVPLGPKAGTAVVKALNQGHVVPLLCDRDIEGNGVEVEFFGERTTIPAGPVTLALRTGHPLFPSAMYFSEAGHHSVIRPPMVVERQGRLRDDVARLSQELAHHLEDLIRAAPDQWHLQQPNWPSDWDALEAIGRHYPRPGEQHGS